MWWEMRCSQTCLTAAQTWWCLWRAQHTCHAKSECAWQVLVGAAGENNEQRGASIVHVCGWRNPAPFHSLHALPGNRQRTEQPPSILHSLCYWSCILCNIDIRCPSH